MILAGTLSALVLAPAAEAYPGAPWFRPSVVYTGNFPDPSVVVVGRSYVAYATTTGGAYLPAETSTDLVHWTARPSYDPGAPENADPYFNDALPRPARWGVNQGSGRLTKTLVAPGVARIGGQWHAYYAVLVRQSPPRFCLSVATATSALGPSPTTAPAHCHVTSTRPALWTRSRSSTPPPGRLGSRGRAKGCPVTCPPACGPRSSTPRDTWPPDQTQRNSFAPLCPGRATSSRAPPWSAGQAATGCSTPATNGRRPTTPSDTHAARARPDHVAEEAPLHCWQVRAPAWDRAGRPPSSTSRVAYGWPTTTGTPRTRTTRPTPSANRPLPARRRARGGSRSRLSSRGGQDLGCRDDAADHTY